MNLGNFSRLQHPDFRASSFLFCEVSAIDPVCVTGYDELYSSSIKEKRPFRIDPGVHHGPQFSGWWSFMERLEIVQKKMTGSQTLPYTCTGKKSTTWCVHYHRWWLERVILWKSQLAIIITPFVIGLFRTFYAIVPNRSIFSENFSLSG